jgi:hypothetical protein
VQANLVDLKMGVDSLIKKIWGIFGIPFLEENYFDLHVSRRSYVSDK